MRPRSLDGQEGLKEASGPHPFWRSSSERQPGGPGSRGDGGPRAGALIWMAFLAAPLSGLFGRTPPASMVHITVVLALGIAFGLSYATVVMLPDERRQALPRRLRIALVTWQVAVLIFLSLYDGGGWAYFFTYTLFPLFRLVRRPFPVVVGSALVTGAAALIGGLSPGNAIGPVATVAGVGLAFVSFTRLTEANEALRRAQDDQARVAVAEERLRFSRDLHDLLGHSLSVITLKSEVAGRLLANQPGPAAKEVAEIEAVAREALREVRDAVTGYRRATLAVELAGARRALAAAGIAWNEDIAPIAPPAKVEGPLAWALREGVTNVIRHSEGRSCRLSLQTIGPDAVITVTDDGVAPAAPGVPTAPGAPSVFAPPILLGNGLRGLGERLALAGGRLDVGPVAAGGFRLRASVPLAVPVPSRSAAPGQAARNEAPADPAGRPAAPAPR
jgi:two-component system sensor histidine kinase DesK